MTVTAELNTTRVNERGVVVAIIVTRNTKQQNERRAVAIIVIPNRTAPKPLYYPPRELNGIRRGWHQRSTVTRVFEYLELRNAL